MQPFTSLSTDKPDVLDIEWVISNYCNFSCSYCTPDLYSNTSRALDLKTACDFFNNVHSLYPGNKMLSLSGGEPTLWKHLPAFVDAVADKYYFHIITNGSRTLDWWQNFMYNRKIDRVTISIHSEFVDYDKTYSVIKYLSTLCDVTVLMLFKPGGIEQLDKFAQRLVADELSISIKIKPLTSHDSRKVFEYSAEEQFYFKQFNYNKSLNRNKEQPIANRIILDGKEYTQDVMYNMITDGKNSFKDWLCDLGRSRMFIWYDGNVYTATCKTGMTKPIGNMFDNTLEPFTTPTICKDNYCHCIPDIRIPKRQNV